MKHDIRDMSRPLLEIIAEHLSAEVSRGKTEYACRLEAVKAQIPRAPDYEITHARD